jgi:hypothetical protein
MSPNPPARKRAVAVLLLSAAVFLSAGGLMRKGMDAAGLGRLKASNDAYLSASFDKALKTFGVLSAVKVGLAIVQGSDVGIGFNLEVGDVVQSAYDYVDIAWRVVLGCAAVLMGTRYLLQAADLLSSWFLAATFAAVLLGLVAAWTLPRLRFLRSFLRDAAWTAGLVTVALTLAVPFSVAGGHWLSMRITKPSVEQASDGFQRIRTELEGPQTGRSGLWGKITEGKEKLERVAAVIARRTGELTEWVLKLIAGFVFDCIVFPALVFLALYAAVRRGAGVIRDSRKRREFRSDLAEVLGPTRTGG